MPLEDITAGSTIATLDAAYPASTDDRREAPTLFQNIKKALQYTFPNVSATVSGEAAELAFAHHGGTVSGTAIFLDRMTMLNGFKVSQSSSVILAQGNYAGDPVYQIDADFGVQDIGQDVFYPLLMNSGFEVRQETTATRTLANATKVYGPDGWFGQKTCSASLLFYYNTGDVPTVANAGAYIPASLYMKAPVPAKSPSANAYAYFAQPMEGSDFQMIAQRAFTLGFWAKSPIVGTHVVAFKNSGGDQSYLAEYQISGTATWEYKTLTIPASPSAGTWGYGVNVGFYVLFSLLGGTGFRANPDEWSAVDSYCTTAQVNVVSATDAYLAIAAPVIVPGNVARKWVTTPLPSELERCRRYYQKTYAFFTDPGTTNYIGSVQGEVPATTRANSVINSVRFPVTMRSVPSMTIYSPSTGDAGFCIDADSSASLTATALNPGPDGCTFALEVTATTSNANRRFALHYVADARL